MTRNDIYDDTDRRIACALQVNGRSPWDLIGQALGISERTAARRGRRLLQDGVVRVMGVLDTQLVGRPAPVLLRLRGETGAALKTAQALSDLPETRSVMTLLGSSDYFTEVVPHSVESLRGLLYGGLPDGIRVSSSYPVLKFFTAAHAWNGGALAEEEMSVLRPAPLPPFGGRRPEVALQPDDLRVAALLACEGRITSRKLADCLRVSQATASRRLSALLDMGVVRTRADVAPSLFGLGTEALLWLQVPFRHLEEVGSTLAAHPSVMTLVSVTGDYQICAHVAVVDHHALQAFLAEVVGSLDAVADADVSIVLETFKRGGLAINAVSCGAVPGNDAPATEPPHTSDPADPAQPIDPVSPAGPAGPVRRTSGPTGAGGSAARLSSTPEGKEDAR